MIHYFTLIFFALLSVVWTTSIATVITAGFINIPVIVLLILLLRHKHTHALTWAVVSGLLLDLVAPNIFGSFMVILIITYGIGAWFELHYNKKTLFFSMQLSMLTILTYYVFLFLSTSMNNSSVVLSGAFFFQRFLEWTILVLIITTINQSFNATHDYKTPKSISYTQAQ